MPPKKISLNKALLCAIIAQILGGTSGTVFSNGFMTAWMKELKLSGSFILLLMSLPSATGVFLGIPAAYWADSRGKKFVGNLGSILTALSFGVFALPAFFQSLSPMVTICVGMFMFSLGTTLFNSSWLGLISPIIPKSYRGRFFGRLRMSWRVVTVILSFIIMGMLALCPGQKTFGITLLVVMVIVLLRSWPYKYIPERPDSGHESRESIIKSSLNLFKAPVYRNFILYLFIITLLTGSFGTLTTLIEKEVLQFSNDTIVLMGNILFVGTVVGFYVGGQVVDKINCFSMFLWGQVLNSILLMSLSLHLVSDYDQIIVGTVFFLFGAGTAAVGIATSSQLFAVMPGTQRALATTMCTVAGYLGIFISGFTVSGITVIVDLYPVQIGTVKVSIYDIVMTSLGIILFCSLPALKLLRANREIRDS